MSLHTFFGENSNVAFMPRDPLTISLPLISQVDPTLDKIISRLCMRYRAIKTPVSAVMRLVSLIADHCNQNIALAHLLRTLRSTMPLSRRVRWVSMFRHDDLKCPCPPSSVSSAPWQKIHRQRNFRMKPLKKSPCSPCSVSSSAR